MRLFPTLTILLWISLASARVGNRDDQGDNMEENLDESSRNLRFSRDPGGNSGGNSTGGNNEENSTGGNSGGRFSDGNGGGNSGNNGDNPGNGGDNPGNGVDNPSNCGRIPGQPIPDQYILNLSRADGDKAKGLLYALLIRNPDAQVVHTYTQVFNGYAVSGLPGAALQNLANQNPDVIFSLEQDSYVQTTNAVWGLDRIDQLTGSLDGNYNPPSGLDGSGVDIYIIDTGLRSTHNEFRGRVKTGRSFVGGTTNDANGHGTHVASTAAGTTFGVAKRASIIPVKVLGDDGSGTISGVISGVDWVANQHKQSSGKKSVANLSLVGGSSGSLNTAVNRAASDGVVMVVAAGNDEVNACNYSPAGASSAITVGSTDPTDRRSSFSNHGSCLDIFAPGRGITGAWIGSDSRTNIISGTSMASPHVAGAVALLMQFDDRIDGTRSNSDIVGRLDNTAVSILDRRSGSPNTLLNVNCITSDTCTSAPTTARPTPSPTTGRPSPSPTPRPPTPSPTTASPTAVPVYSRFLSITVVYDAWPAETTYGLEKWNGNQWDLLFSDGGGVPSSTVRTDFALEEDGTYRFYMNDVFGDGICCTYGPGSYTLMDTERGIMIASGGQFGKRTENKFLVSSGPEPTGSPSSSPTKSPTHSPSTNPSSFPSSTLTQKPTLSPTTAPTKIPTPSPSVTPTTSPSVKPTAGPTSSPSGAPTNTPTFSPSTVPTVVASESPTASPSKAPSESPSNLPTYSPSGAPTSVPSEIPSSFPSVSPSNSPSTLPSVSPSLSPTVSPSDIPTTTPSSHPSLNPSLAPSVAPSSAPSVAPSSMPSRNPTGAPSDQPSSAPATASPSANPSAAPVAPTPEPEPTSQPSGFPSSTPTGSPSAIPTANPTSEPTSAPSSNPTEVPSSTPTSTPTSVPSSDPSSIPTVLPSDGPTSTPSVGPSSMPTQFSSESPSVVPTAKPSWSPSEIPTGSPSLEPTAISSESPSSEPTKAPSHSPSQEPSVSPSQLPTSSPSILPSASPVVPPTAAPTGSPVAAPVDIPVSFTMAVTYDLFPQETYFEFSRVTESGTQIRLVSRPTEGFPRYQTVTVTQTLTNGYYAFDILDSWKDGMCCTYGSGGYSLSADGIVLASGGQFGAREFVCLEVKGGTVTVLAKRDAAFDCRTSI